ncbi:MAG: GNAT family N-acetyltransferase [Sphaerochaetaceae bacterium]|jgi:GNAT superfamily N-acetyltransferase
MDLVVTDGNDQRFVRLCRELDDYLNTVLCPEKQKEQYARYNTLEDIHDVVLLLVHGDAVACGGFKEYGPGVAEIKRVFTNAAHRHCGYGTIILQALEKQAGSKGYKRLVLETGVSLEAAQKLYRNVGFHIIPNYGQYLNMRGSVCMEKLLVR